MFSYSMMLNNATVQLNSECRMNFQWITTFLVVIVFVTCMRVVCIVLYIFSYRAAHFPFSKARSHATARSTTTGAATCSEIWLEGSSCCFLSRRKRLTESVRSRTSKWSCLERWASCFLDEVFFHKIHWLKRWRLWVIFAFGIWVARMLNNNGVTKK